MATAHIQSLPFSLSMTSHIHTSLSLFFSSSLRMTTHIHTSLPLLSISERSLNFSQTFKEGQELKSRVQDHLALKRRNDAVTTSLDTSQWCHRYVPNETPNDVSMKRCQDVSVVHLLDVLLERRNNVSKNVTTKSHQHVSTTSQTSPKWNTQRLLSGTLPRRLSGTYPRLPMSTSQWCLL